jgi:hypothetical protein
VNSSAEESVFVTGGGAGRSGEPQLASNARTRGMSSPSSQITAVLPS